MYDGWLSLGGTELHNSERVVAYATRLGIEIGPECETCPDLHEALLENPYSSPDADDAPWYDPQFAESKMFCGFYPLSVDGVDSATGIRTPSDLAQGAAIGALRRAQREVVVRVLAVGADDCAVSYGVAWLASALRGTGCVGCAGDTLCLFSCCPEGTGERHLRTLYDVGLLEAPTRVDSIRLGDGPCAGLCQGVGAVAVELEYTLVAGTSYLYHEPTAALVFDRPALVSGIVDPPVCPGESTNCAADPNCAALPARPSVPIPADPCGCVIPSSVRRAAVSFPPSQMARWLESVPIVTIKTGDTAARCLRVRYFANPLGRPCTHPLDGCGFCGELGITYLPANSTLIVDGRNRTYSLDCSASGHNPAVMPPSLYASNGQAYAWPVLDCPGGLCVELLAVELDYNATVTVALAAREDAA